MSEHPIAVKLKRIYCALFRHGRIGRYGELGLSIFVCDRCGQILAVSTDSVGFMDKVHFPDPREDEMQFEGVWQEWGRT